ncbi:MAG TPA: glycosyltransferase [Candidatus Paceibacterota bacterium]|nr:glycosyltransferase [Candidatus Paceibacterota bacterium]
MKVLIASDTYYPHVNGASYFTQRLATALVERGHEVAVIAPSLTIHNDVLMRGNAHMFGVRSFPILIVPKFRFVLPWIINRRIEQVIREFKPDIVHIQMHFPVSRAVLKAAQRLDIPVVATNHFMPDNLTHYLHLPGSITRAINAAMWWDAARVLDKAQAISAPTQTSVEIMQPQLVTKMQVISNGINLTRFNPKNDPALARKQYKLPDVPILLFVGRLDREKNVDLVLRAAQTALKETDFHFVIAGHGAEGAKLKRLAAKLGMEEKVTFAGFVPDELLPSLYAASDAFVIAGIAELQCIVAMEAMASGLPVLAARAVALPELVHQGENGYLFEPGDVKELSRRIIEIFNDAPLRKRMGAKSLEIIAHHDIDVVMERFEQFYREAIEATATR